MADQNKNRGSGGDEMDRESGKQGSSGSQSSGGSSRGSQAGPVSPDGWSTGVGLRRRVPASTSGEQAPARKMRPFAVGKPDFRTEFDVRDDVGMIGE